MKKLMVENRVHRRMRMVLVAATLVMWFSQVQAERVFPDVNLPSRAKGAAAVAQLGAHLPDVAAWHGTSAEELRDILNRDKSLEVDRRGRLLYSCSMGPHVEEDIVITWPDDPDPVDLPFPKEQTFQLHSSPNSSKVIYLDFAGERVSGTVWNSEFNGGQDLNMAPFDIDGSPSTFSDDECLRIQLAWQRVAEDYAPFDVDVTTEPPAASALSRSSSSDEQYGMHVVISPSSFYAAAGIAYVGVFNMTGDHYRYAFCFSPMCNNLEKAMAEVCSHEVGHTLGLHHDGTVGGNAYYPGHNGWAPIMGGGANSTTVISQWSKGEYPNANNHEDDLAVIQAHGLAYYPDDFGSTFADAEVLTAGTIDLIGVIEKNIDLDIFAFATWGGNLDVTLSPADHGPNLNIAVFLHDGSGGLMAWEDNASELSAAMSVSLAAGTYYLVVEGTEDPVVDYSAYGSLGQYVLTGTYSNPETPPDPPPATPDPPVAEIHAPQLTGTAPATIAFSAAGSSDPDGAIVSYLWTFGDGTQSDLVSPSKTYAAAGTYVVTLVVTDNDGLQDSASVTVTVEEPVALRAIHVADIAMALKAVRNKAAATATVSVVDADGTACSGATVTIAWSGLVSGTATGVTGANGSVVLESPSTRKTGTFTAAVVGLTAAGPVYDGDADVETVDSVSNGSTDGGDGSTDDDPTTKPPRGKKK